MASYTPLLREGKFPNDEDEHGPESMNVCDCGVHHGKPTEFHWEKQAVQLAIYACLVALACTFLNISFLAIRPALITNDVKYSRIRLETPSSYYGLQNAVLDPTAPPSRPISNVPFLAAQINESSPTSIFFENNRHFTDFGTAYPTDRKFLVAPEVSTVVQFRVMDFGMEKCTLTLSTSMPPKNTEPGHGHGVGRDMHEHPFGRIEVWNLDEGRRIDPEVLSWRTRPRRSLLVTSWDLSEAERMESAEFRCISGSILTFELACAGECRLTFNQPREKPHSALLLIQSSSL